MNTFKWLLKREFWEHKLAFLLVPVVTGTVMTLIITVSLAIAVLGLGNGVKINGVDVSSLAAVVTPLQKSQFASQLVAGYAGLAMPFFIALGFCVFFFCVNALFDERRDRSVLFWKSLPIADGTTVLSKVAMAIGIAPVITMVVATITAVLAGILICIAAAIAGVNIFSDVLGNPATYLVPVQLAALLPIYALWALPTVGWLLLVSAWARTKPLLWAVGVPVMAGTLASWANGLFQLDWNVGWFWKNIVARLLVSVLPGSWLAGQHRALPGDQSPMGETLARSWQMLASADIWIGVLLGAAMIFAAIRMRGLRDEG